MAGVALATRPQMATLVPEGRQEITTEGGLDVAGQRDRLKAVVARLAEAGIRVSAFIDAEADQIEAAAACGFHACEIHTGPWAEAFHAHGRGLDDPRVRDRLDQVAEAGRRIQAAGMQFNAGHALTYANVAPIAGLPGVRELHIGHSIVSRAVFIGLREAVAEMKRLLTGHGGRQ
jgi:pyridoxine 5-phosphate synthase